MTIKGIIFRELYSIPSSSRNERQKKRNLESFPYEEQIETDIQQKYHLNHSIYVDLITSLRRMIEEKTMKLKTEEEKDILSYECEQLKGELNEVMELYFQRFGISFEDGVFPNGNIE